MKIKKALLKKLRLLSSKKQREVLNLVELLQQGTIESPKKLTKKQLQQALLREQLLRQKAIKESSIAFAESARDLWLLNRSWDARLAALKAGRLLLDNQLSPPTDSLSIVTDTLRQVASKKEGELFQESNRLVEHSGLVNSVSFSPDGEAIATASSDKTAKLWNREGQLLQTLRGHLEPVISTSFSPDGELIATASSDSTVILWDVWGFNELMKLNCQFVGGYLRNNPEVEESERGFVRRFRRFCEKPDFWWRKKHRAVGANLTGGKFG